MEGPLLLDAPCLEVAFDRLYRDFFHQAERKRRWSLPDDIPWEQVNESPDPTVADVIESFCAVELYLPDYVGNAMSLFRPSRAFTWFYANWGYEESKHSLALEDWLLRSGARTDEQMADLGGQVLARPWRLPHDSPVAMLIYAMVQELATGVNYRNLRRRVDGGGDPALAKLLGFLSVDEQSHHRFFLRAVQLYLRHDRPGTLHQLQRVLHDFAMPAIDEFVDGPERVQAIQALGVFDPLIYFREVYHPILTALGVKRSELQPEGSPKRANPAVCQSGSA
jgi:acyl-[acyl-carrier-protein] desaturase